MKTNLKEKTIEQKKKSKVITNIPTSKEQEVDNEEQEYLKEITISWKDEINNFKNIKFSSLDEMREHIVDVVLQKQNQINDKAQREFLISMLEDNEVINDFLKSFLKK